MSGINLPLIGNLNLFNTNRNDSQPKEYRNGLFNNILSIFNLQDAPVIGSVANVLDNCIGFGANLGYGAGYGDGYYDGSSWLG